MISSEHGPVNLGKASVVLLFSFACLNWPQLRPPVPSPMHVCGAVQTKQEGSNPNYAKVKFEGGPAAVKSVTCDGTPGEMTAEGFFVWGGGFGCGTVQCSIQYSNGKSGSCSVSGC